MNSNAIVNWGARNLNPKDKLPNKLQKKNKFIYLVLTLIVLMFSITGATFAYFALTASNNSTITGTVGGATLSLTVTKSFPTATTSMVPQLESTLDEAISTTYSCVDGNNNVVCQVYKAVIKNTGTTSAELTGTISFQNIDTLPNLKWKQLTSERVIGEDTGHNATTTEQTFEAKKTFASNETATYYFVIWIDEIGVEQTDRGTFRATINFKPTNETGITSTITPNTAELKLGSYVSFTPTKSSYTTNTTKTGYGSTQTINPQELNLWRVISLNEDGTVDLISEHVSSVAIYFSGKTGYLNLVGYLNVLASQYENSTYTTGSRYFGYNGQTEYITDTSKFTNPAPWTCSTGGSCNPVESQGGGDTLYTTDYNLVNTVLGTRVATNLSGIESKYWMASRYYGYSSSTNYHWTGHSVNTSGRLISENLYYYYSSSFSRYSYSNPLRPIVTLKSGLNYSGAGTETEPLEITGT